MTCSWSLDFGVFLMGFGSKPHPTPLFSSLITCMWGTTDNMAETLGMLGNTGNSWRDNNLKQNNKAGGLGRCWGKGPRLFGINPCLEDQQGISASEFLLQKMFWKTLFSRKACYSLNRAGVDRRTIVSSLTHERTEILLPVLIKSKLAICLKTVLWIQFSAFSKQCVGWQDGSHTASRLRGFSERDLIYG